MIEAHFGELEAMTSTSAACDLLGVSRATRYRRQRPPLAGPPPPRPAPPNKLTEAERQHVLTVLRSEEYCDLAPAQVWARLLDDGIYLCSISTMYRLLAIAGENRERRRQRTHPATKKPELIARRPNEVWSWDITKLQGPTRGVYYELFVVIDIFSRYVVGWMVSPAETGELAEAFIADTLQRHGIGPGQLSLHADRGTSMTSKPVAQLLVDLGVARSHSRPHVSNDKALCSHCTSWGRLDRDSLGELAAHALDEAGVARWGSLVELFVLVVGLVAGEEPGGVPALDGVGVDLEQLGDLGEGEHPAGAEPVGVAGEPVGAA
jgi:putative transposase